MSLARRLMQIAVMVAPPERKQWAAAMAGEAHLARTDKLGWAIGSLTVAAGWRLRHEAIYVLVMMALFFGWSWLVIAGMALWQGPHVLFWMAATDVVPKIAIAFALCLYRPRRMLLTVVALPALTELRVFADFVQRSFPVWDSAAKDFAFDLAVMVCWPFAAGALLAWLWLKLRPRPALA